MDVTKDLYWRLELKEWFFIFKYFLYFFEQMIDYFLGQVDEWNIFGILALIVHNLVIQVVDNDVHDEFLLVYLICLRDLLEALFKLLTPHLLDVQRLGLVLLRLQILTEQLIQALSV